MIDKAPPTPTAGSLLYRAARALCPRGDRVWIDALFAELPRIHGRRARASWMLGALPVVASTSMAAAAISVPGKLRWALLACFAVLLLSGGNAYYGYELAGIDDDAFLATALAAAAASIALTALSARRVIARSYAADPAAAWRRR